MQSQIDRVLFLNLFVHTTGKFAHKVIKRQSQVFAAPVLSTSQGPVALQALNKLSHYGQDTTAEECP